MIVRVPALPGRLHPRTVPALLEQGAEAVEVLSCAGGDGAYSGHLLDLWRNYSREPTGVLVLVEHDVEVLPGQLEQLDSCPEPWCCFPYGSEALLGCTRFRTRSLPRLPLELLGTHWQQLDMALYRFLIRQGFRPHTHRPAPLHHHGWSDSPGAGR